MRNVPLNRPSKIRASYGFLRALVRLGVWLFLPEVRLLNKEKFTQCGPAAMVPVVLVVNYPESFLAALLLVASIEFPVLCLLSPQNLRGAFQKLLGWGLGFIPSDHLAKDPGQKPNLFAGTLGNWGAVALFAGQSGKNEAPRMGDRDLLADFILETLERSHDGHPPAICLVHALIPPGGRKSGLLLSVDGPLETKGSPEQSFANSKEASQHLAASVQKILQENVFALEATEIERFHRDLENIAHEDLEDEWSRFPDWKQQPGDMQLSGLVKQWIQKQNQNDPGRLVALRKLVEDYREARRRCSLEQFRMGTSGGWHDSGSRVAIAWVESLLGLPIALYGFINHLPAGAILFLAGLLKKSPQRDPKVEWFLRAFIVFSCYTVQVLLFDLWLGRAAAGYYTLTLPVSGAYLWRYRWLARHRSHLLLLKLSLPRRLARLRQVRKTLLRKLDGEANLHAKSLGLPS